MAPSSPSNGDTRLPLEAQLRECFGRVVYSHKTHEKCADLLLCRLARIKFWQIVLAAITAGGGVTATFNIAEQGQPGAIAAAVVALALVVLNAYMKENDLGQLAQKHKQTAADLWLAREKYLSLLTDLAMRQISMERIAAGRDALLEELHAIYAGAPATTSAAYKQAQVALKVNEDMTFTEQEIDAFLPKELRRGSRTPAS